MPKQRLLEIDEICFDLGVIKSLTKRVRNLHRTKYPSDCYYRYVGSDSMLKVKFFFQLFVLAAEQGVRGSGISKAKLCGIPLDSLSET